ncbi:MAG TPA: hypothetical protein VFX86_00190 [Candidatus Saccharimonadales bacterium]|nr:hypothetical protein [Candidatus Saccharimonadales bacterium]
MTGTNGILKFNLVESDPQYHLVGDEMVHGEMFTNYSVYALEQGESDDPSHVLHLPRLHGVSEELDQLIESGWQKGVFVGKLMASSSESEQSEIEATQKSDKKSMPADKIRQLAQKKAGFTTGLFVVQPILEYSDALGAISERLPEQAIPYLVAGVHQNGSRSLRIISADQEEYHYGEHHGEKIKELAALDVKVWDALQSVHDMMYSQAVDLIVQRGSSKRSTDDSAA